MKENFKLIKEFFSNLFAKKNTNNPNHATLPKNHVDKKSMTLIDVSDLYEKYDFALHSALSHEKSNMPGIKGSNILLFMKGFHKLNLECGKLKEIDDGYQIDMMNNDYAYYITANKNFELSSFQISLFNSKLFNEILAYCCEIEYSTKNYSETKKLLENKADYETNAVIIGDAYFEINTDLKGTVFVIKALGFDRYVTTLLEN